MKIVDRIINAVICGLCVFVSVLPLKFFMHYVMDLRISEQYGQLTETGFIICLFIFAEAYKVIMK